MKTVKWLGGVSLLTGAVLAGLVATAASGDRLVIIYPDSVQLSGAQKTAYAGWGKGVWPGVTLAKINNVECNRGPAKCRLSWEVTGTSGQMLADKDANLLDLGCPVEKSGSDVTYCRWEPWTVLTSQQKTDLKGLAEGVWPTIDASVMEEHSLSKRGAVVRAEIGYHDVFTPDEYAQALADGVGFVETGTVE